VATDEGIAERSEAVETGSLQALSVGGFRQPRAFLTQLAVLAHDEVPRSAIYVDRILIGEIPS
jgi:hypothetical protein